jgi:hypothetical protein
MKHYSFFFLMAPNRVLIKAEKINLYYLEQWQHARARIHASSCGDCGGNSGKGGSFFSEYSTFPLSTYFSQCPILIFIFKVTPDLAKRKRSGRLPTEAAREKSTVDHAYNITKRLVSL